MNISKEKHTHLKKFGLFLPVLLIGAAAGLNAFISPPKQVSENLPKKDVLTSVPNAQNQEIADKDKALEEITALNRDTANLIPDFTEITPDKGINADANKKEMDEILKSLDNNNTVTKQPTSNAAYNDNVPTVITRNYPEPKNSVIKKESVVIADDEPTEPKVKVDPYAPNKSMTLGEIPKAASSGKSMYSATVLNEAWVVDGDVINVRNTEDIQIGGVRIPRNSVLVGAVNISSNRMFISVNLEDYGVDGKYIEVMDAKQNKGIKLTSDVAKTSAANNAISKVDDAINASGTNVGGGLFGRIRNIGSGVGKSNRPEYQIPGGFKIKLAVKDIQ